MYLQLGIEHITDLKGYDHILFLITLMAVYQLKHWKKILILITAFTIGHTISLILSSFNLVSIPRNWIEFLIPVTILLTAIGNMMQTEDDFSKRLHHYKYLLAIGFGLIHGLGFSNYLRALILNEESLAGPLFSFNLGIEAGQLLIVSGFILLGILMMGRFKVRPREWNLVFSGAGLGVSIILMIERMPL
jgi:tetrahydromethanopterin S-methyltransferase subunit E